MISDSTVIFLTLRCRASHDTELTNGYGMIFVPSKDRISHSSEEYTSPEQCDNGIMY